MSSGARGQVGMSYSFIHYVEYLQLLELLCLFLLLPAGIIVFHVRRILQMSTCVQVDGTNDHVSSGRFFCIC